MQCIKVLACIGPDFSALTRIQYRARRRPYSRGRVDFSLGCSTPICYIRLFRESDQSFAEFTNVAVFIQLKAKSGKSYQSCSTCVVFSLAF